MEKGRKREEGRKEERKERKEGIGKEERKERKEGMACGQSGLGHYDPEPFVALAPEHKITILLPHS